MPEVEEIEEGEAELLAGEVQKAQALTGALLWLRPSTSSRKADLSFVLFVSLCVFGKLVLSEMLQAHAHDYLPTTDAHEPILCAAYNKVFSFSFGSRRTRHFEESITFGHWGQNSDLDSAKLCEF